MHIKRLINILPQFLLMPQIALAGDFVYEAGRGLKFCWTADEKVGIAEPSSNEQLCFWTSSTEMAQQGERALYATGFILKQNVEYCSYYPYQWSSSFDAKNLTFSYLGQYEADNNNTTHLGNYDYSIAKSKTSSSDCTFTYKRIGCVLRIEAVMPRGLKVAELQVKTKSNSIPVKANVNLTNESVAWLDYRSSISLGHSGFGFVRGAKYQAYVAFPAVDLTNEQLTFTLVGMDKSTITFATIAGINFQAGKLYDLNLSTTSTVTAHPFSSTTATKSESLSRPVAHVNDIPLATNYTVDKITALLGDLNNDGKVNILDVTHLIRHIKNNTATSLDKNIADVDGNGTINTLDIKALSKICINNN